jgi:hypothetical protein
MFTCRDGWHVVARAGELTYVRVAVRLRDEHGSHTALSAPCICRVAHGRGLGKPCTVGLARAAGPCFVQAGHWVVQVMKDTPSADPRDQAIRAALRDAATLAAMVVTEFRASYWGAERTVYVATLAAYVSDLGGRLEEAGTRDLVADFGGRRITVRFG